MSNFPTSPLAQPVPVTEGRTISWAARYDLLVFLLTLGRASALRVRTAELAQLSPGEAVLDVGCGTGDLALEVCRRVGQTGLVAGIDAAPEMIARARKKAEHHGSLIDFRVEAVEALSFANSTFDAIVCSLMFHHLPPSLKLQGLAEMRRVLKPGGRLLIVDFLRPEHRFRSHYALHTGVQDLPALLSEAGFVQVELKRGPFPLLGSVCGVSAYMEEKEP